MARQAYDKSQPSPRESEVQALKARGLTHAQIAMQLGISKGTVERHCESMGKRRKAKAMHDRHHKASDAQAMSALANGMDSNKSEVPKDQAGILKRIEVGDMTAIIYAQGEASIGVNTKYVDNVVALDPEEARALYGFLKEHYEGEAHQ